MKLNPASIKLIVLIPTTRVERFLEKIWFRDRYHHIVGAHLDAAEREGIYW
jgi:hypothetical protein